MPPLGGDKEEVKEKKKIKNLNSKQIIEQASSFSIISTNKSWK